MLRTSLRSAPIVLLILGAYGCSSATSTPDDNTTFDAGATGDTGGSTDDGGSSFDIGDNDGGITAVDLVVTPGNAVVYIDTGKSPLAGGTQAYTATEDPMKDVTAGTTFTVEDPGLGSFTGNVFTSVTDLGKDAAGNPILGKTSIIDAQAADGKKGQAKITVVKLRKTEDPTTSARDFFFIVPYMQAPDPKEDILKFTTNIQQIDVAFVTDTTGSMSGEIGNLKTNLSSTIVPGLKAAIPSVGIAIVDHRDFPVTPYGGTGTDWPAKIWAPITVQDSAAALSKVQSAIANYSAGGGYDTPEAQIAGMYYTLTNKPLSWTGGSLAAATVPAGTTGAVGFRPSAVPVVVETTDASWHNGVGSPYSGFTAPTLTDLENAFKAANAKFVGININLGYGDSPIADANALSDATGSSLPPSAFDGPGKPASCGTGQCCTGLNGAGIAPDAPGGRCRLNFAASSSGTGVSTGVVNAIKALASGSVYDILPELSNDPTNAGGVDATKFIDRLEAFTDSTMGCAGTPRKSTASMAYNDMIGGIVAGKQTACFKVIPHMNTTVPAKETAQFFKAKIAMKGIAPGADVTPTTPRIDLGDVRTVLFMVPPTAIGPK